MGASSSSNIFRAVLLGLDAAGKTTVLASMSGTDIPSGPTIEHHFAKSKLYNLFPVLFLYFSNYFPYILYFCLLF